MAGCELTGTAAGPSHHTAMETVDVAAWASLSLCYVIGSSMDKTPAEELITVRDISRISIQDGNIDGHVWHHL
jgi:hypothetical protein